MGMKSQARAWREAPAQAELRPTCAGSPHEPAYKLAPIGYDGVRILDWIFPPAGLGVPASSLCPNLQIPLTVCPRAASLAGVSGCCSLLEFRRSESGDKSMNCDL